jgi:adenylate cyclase
VRVAVLTAAAGLVFLALFGGDLEEVYGLDLLFQLRGPAPAPPGIVVVAIDRASAERLGLPSPPWPRTVHADLIRKLDQSGAAAIVFDLLFDKERPSEDKELAGAMRQVRRVALLQGLERRTISTPTEGNRKESGQGFDAAIDPIQIFRNTAVAVAPFPVPTDTTRVTRFWTFRSGTDLPTLPSVALQLAASDIAEDWARILATENIFPRESQVWTDQRLVQSMSELRRQLKAMPSIENRLGQAIGAVGRLEPAKARRLSALLALYVGEDSRLLNFHGPAGTITTIPYASILNGEKRAAEIEGKIILVGFDEREVVNNVDNYETVYSGTSGIDLSGVEILGTGLANLMNDSALRTSGVGNALIVVVVALILGLAAVSASDLVLAGASIMLLFAVPALGYYLFVSANFVVSVFTPLAVELPIGILTIGLSLMTAERRLRRAIESAARQFLPNEVANALVFGPLSRSTVPTSKIGTAIFLATDVKGFTPVAERLSPQALDELVKDYLGPLFETVVRHGGNVLNLTGESMMCAWPTDGEPLQARTNAVTAALEMADLVGKFGVRHPSSPMPTRFGLRAGAAAFGVVGGSGRYLSTVVGDVANTVSRIESLNSLLHTRVLASAEVVERVEGLIVRPLGTFAPVGKSESVDVTEILGPTGKDRRLTALAESFAVALAVFDAERWSDASKRFRVMQEDYPTDGPTSYFLNLAEGYLRSSPPPGTARPIRLNVK